MGNQAEEARYYFPGPGITPIDYGKTHDADGLTQLSQIGSLVHDSATKLLSPSEQWVETDCILSTVTALIEKTQTLSDRTDTAFAQSTVNLLRQIHQSTRSWYFDRESSETTTEPVSITQLHAFLMKRMAKFDVHPDTVFQTMQQHNDRRFTGLRPHIIFEIKPRSKSEGIENIQDCHELTVKIPSFGWIILNRFDDGRTLIGMRPDITQADPSFILYPIRAAKILIAPNQPIQVDLEQSEQSPLTTLPTTHLELQVELKHVFAGFLDKYLLSQPGFSDPAIPFDYSSKYSLREEMFTYILEKYLPKFLGKDELDDFMMKYERYMQGGGILLLQLKILQELILGLNIPVDVDEQAGLNGSKEYVLKLLKTRGFHLRSGKHDDLKYDMRLIFLLPGMKQRLASVWEEVYGQDVSNPSDNTSQIIGPFMDQEMQRRLLLIQDEIIRIGLQMAARDEDIADIDYRIIHDFINR